jgi:hypothetical protein
MNDVSHDEQKLQDHICSHTIVVGGPLNHLSTEVNQVIIKNSVPALKKTQSHLHYELSRLMLSGKL